MERVRQASLFSETADTQWRLPKRLREISGLAVTSDGRLFGHDDEVGMVHQIDVDAGVVGKAFGLGDPVERDDFEGLAITLEGDFYLISSKGLLYRFREGDHGAAVPFETFETGLRQTAEIEGLAYLPVERSLIIASKAHYSRRMRNVLSLYAWSTETRELTTWLTLPLDHVADAVEERTFAPSAVEVDPATGRIVLLSARGGSMVELDRSGEILATRRLAAGHAQAEGVAIMHDGALVIADEGDGGRALLTRYPRAGG
jgi:uncharacterized protein YjiK